MAKGRKTGGRKAGTPNKASIEVEARCRALIEDPKYADYFRHRLEVGQLPRTDTVIARRIADCN